MGKIWVGAFIVISLIIFFGRIKYHIPPPPTTEIIYSNAICRETGVSNKNNAFRHLINLSPVCYFKNMVWESSLRDQLIKMTKATPGDWAIVVEDLESGIRVNLNENAIFYAASLSKIPILMTVYSQIKTGLIRPEDSVVYLEMDFESGSGSLQYAPVGEAYSVRELAGRMIRESDNVAKNMLLRKVGYSSVRQLLELNKANATELTNNTSTAADVSLLLKIIYSESRKGDPYANEMVDFLSTTVFHDRLPNLLPDEIQVAHKIGTWGETGSFHDCGIIYGRNPYLLCILSQGTASAEAQSAISQISGYIYGVINPASSVTVP